MIVTTLPPAPDALEAGIAGLYGGLVALVAIWIVRGLLRFWRLPEKLSTLLIGLLVVFGMLFNANAIRPAAQILWSWAITPIAIRTDDGQLAFGHWWVDAEGVGHAEVVLPDATTCRTTYDGTSSARYVAKRYRCDDLVADLRLVRAGPGERRTRGEGVLRITGPDGQVRYAWFVFGLSARAASLTGGLIGLPDAAPGAAQFAAIEAEGPRLNADASAIGG